MPTDLLLFSSAFVLSALAGVASLLRAGGPLTYKAVATSLSNSGALGLVIALLFVKEYRDNPYFLVGVCVLAGLAGTAATDFVMEWFQRTSTTLFGSKPREK